MTRIWTYARPFCIAWVLLFTRIADVQAGVAPDQAGRCDDMFQAAGATKGSDAADQRFSTATDGSGAWRASPLYPSAMRIGIWGDSHTASGSFVDAALQAWGFSTEGLRAGHVQAAMGLPGVRLGIARTCLTKAWNLQFAFRTTVPEAGFTSSLVKLKSQANDEAVVLDFVGSEGASAPQWLTIHLDKPDPGGILVLGIAINGGPESVPLVLEGDVRALQILPETEIRTLRLRLIAGQLGITGFEPMYRNASKLLVDIFSTPGAQSKAWSNQKIRPVGAGYDMVIFQYGTNEAPSDSFQPEQYALALRKELRQFRAIYPKSRCVLIGPPDRVVIQQSGTAIDFAARHQTINKIQAFVSPEFRCEFWDWQKAMGGPRSVLAWAKRAEPLAQPDLTHLSSLGYAYSARLFASAIRRPTVQAK